MRVPDGSKWHDFFHMRLSDSMHYYYFAWNDSKERAFPDCFDRYEDAKSWIQYSAPWKQIVDEVFEKEILG